MTGRATTTAPSPSRAVAAPGTSGTAPGSVSRPLVSNPSQRPARAPAPSSVDRGPDMAHQWPMRDFLELGALPGAAPCARLHARQIMWEWALTSLTEAVEQVVAELVTNSVAAARAMPLVQPVCLWLLSDAKNVLVLVWDASPQPPALAEPDEDAESGRGLCLVEAFSERWGSYATPQTGGKVVWALCSMEADQPTAP